MHRVDGDVLPFWERCGLEDYVRGLENADGEGGDGVVGIHAAAVGGVDCDAGVAVGDVGYDGVEKEARVVVGEELGRLAVQEGVVSSLVNGELV